MSTNFVVSFSVLRRCCRQSGVVMCFSWKPLTSLIFFELWGPHRASLPYLPTIFFFSNIIIKVSSHTQNMCNNNLLLHFLPYLPTHSHTTMMMLCPSSMTKVNINKTRNITVSSPFCLKKNQLLVYNSHASKAQTIILPKKSTHDIATQSLPTGQNLIY